MARKEYLVSVFLMNNNQAQDRCLCASLEEAKTIIANTFAHEGFQWNGSFSAETINKEFTARIECFKSSPSRGKLRISYTKAHAVAAVVSEYDKTYPR